MSNNTSKINNVIISLPTANESVHLPINGKNIFSFDFNEADVTFERTDTNLTIAGESGNVVLKGFFELAEDAPTFILADGEAVKGYDFLAAKDIDITTAAGETSATSQSNGLNEYSDSSSDLLGGVDRLGTLGASDLLRTGSAQVADGESGAMYIASSVIGGGNGGGSVAVPGQYTARTVVHMNNGSVPQLVIKAPTTDPSNAKFSIVDNAGDPILGFIDPASASYDPATGEWTFNIDTAALAAIMPTDGSNLYEYIQVMIDGNVYNMQIVFNNSGMYDSIVEDALSSDGFELAPSGLTEGEKHIGGLKNSNGHAIITSDLGDTVDLDGALRGSELHLGEGDNTATIKGTVNSASTITAGSGEDNITITGGVSGAGTVVSLGGGNDTLVSGALGSGAKVLAGSGNDSITVNGSLSGANTVLDTGSGDDTVSITGGVTSNGELLLGAGTNTATIGGSISGKVTDTSGTSDVTANLISSGANINLNDGSLTLNSGIHISALLSSTTTNIEGKNLDIHVIGSKNGTTYNSGILSKGVESFGSKAITNIKTDGKLTVDVHHDPANGIVHSAGLDVRYNGSQINIDAAIVEINTSAQMKSMGAQVLDSDLNINAGTMTINTESISTFAHGLDQYGGKINIVTEDDFTINSKAEAGNYIMTVTDTEIKSLNGDINLNSTGSQHSYSHGATNRQSQSAQIVLNAEQGNVNINLNAGGGGATYSNSLNVGNSNINVFAGQNINYTNHTVDGGAQSIGVSASNSQINLTAGNDINLINKSSGRGSVVSVGIGGGNSSSTVTAGGSINILSETNEGHATGVSVTGNNMVNMTAENISLISESNTGISTGISLASGASAIFRGSDSIFIDADKALDLSNNSHASLIAQNIVIDGNISVADMGTSLNILGNTNDNPVKIVITGDLIGVGLISIETHDGNDHVILNGNILGDASQKSISTGAGDDIISLNGQMEIGFNIDAGSGHDVLELYAPDQATFDAYYQDWLTDLLATGGSNIEEVKIYSPDGIPAWLSTALDENGIVYSHETTSTFGAASFGLFDDISDVDDVDGMFDTLPIETRPLVQAEPFDYSSSTPGSEEAEKLAIMLESGI